MSARLSSLFFAALIAAVLSTVAVAKSKPTAQDLRQAYLASVEQPTAAHATPRTLGSLWSPGAPLGQLASDFKARGLGDSITIVVAELDFCPIQWQPEQPTHFHHTIGHHRAGRTSFHREFEPIAGRELLDAG